ncbi:hypothetical protein CsSME_00020035 [Camellia sinensis var. sinensis]
MCQIHGWLGLCAREGGLRYAPEEAAWVVCQRGRLGLCAREGGLDCAPKRATSIVCQRGQLEECAKGGGLGVHQGGGLVEAHIFTATSQFSPFNSAAELPKSNVSHNVRVQKFTLQFFHNSSSLSIACEALSDVTYTCTHARHRVMQCFLFCRHDTIGSSYVC